MSASDAVGRTATSARRDRARPSSSLADLQQLVAAGFLPRVDPSSGPGAVGLEAEHLVMRVDAGGAPTGRLALSELTGLLDDHPRLDIEPPSEKRLTGWRTADGCRLVPEPGAQLEFAGPPAWTAATASRRLAATTDDLAGYFATRGVALVSAGLDLWHHPATIRQQLRIPRYPAMHAYFAARSPHGHTMMTATASLQLNLDLGPPPTAAERWAVTLLAAPLATATFACSPVAGATNGRAAVWQALDRTRTGIPAAFVRGVDDPVAVLTETALAADVLLVRTTDGALPGQPGFSMRRWLIEGHPEHGWPTRDDLAYHLSTLFPEVRARGFLEVRSVDALPRRWRMVPVVLYCGLLYDPTTRDTVRELMEQHRASLPELLRRAAMLGPADPQLCALSVEVFTAAAEGAARLPEGYIDPADLQRTYAFLDRFTLRGRCPGDELRERFADGPAAALDWAREPAPSLRVC